MCDLQSLGLHTFFIFYQIELKNDIPVGEVRRLYALILDLFNLRFVYKCRPIRTVGVPRICYPERRVDLFEVPQKAKASVFREVVTDASNA